MCVGVDVWLWSYQIYVDDTSVATLLAPRHATVFATVVTSRAVSQCYSCNTNTVVSVQSVFMFETEVGILSLCWLVLISAMLLPHSHYLPFS